MTDGQRKIIGLGGLLGETQRHLFAPHARRACLVPRRGRTIRFPMKEENRA
jgi:RNase P/RNase MRP subunit p29